VVQEQGATLRARARRASSSASSRWTPPRESGRPAPAEAVASGNGGSADGDRSSPDARRQTTFKECETVHARWQ
jgi:hypothetical protein